MNLRDHTFFKTVSRYGQVHIPTAMREELGILGKEIYAMIIVIPVVTKETSMTMDEAYEYLEFLAKQSSEEDLSQSNAVKPEVTSG